MRFWPILVAILLAAPTIQPPARADDTKFTLKLRLKPGEVVRYRTTINFEVNGSATTITRTTKSTVTSVTETGDSTVVTEMLSNVTRVNGMDVENPKLPPVRIQRDKSGKVVEYSTEEMTPGLVSLQIARIIAALGEPIFLNKEVKAADSWKTILQNPAVAEKPISISTELLGQDTVNERPVVKLKQRGEAVVDADGDRLICESTIFVDPPSGRTIRSIQKATGVPTQLGKLSWTSETTRLDSAGGEPKFENAGVDVVDADSNPLSRFAGLYVCYVPELWYPSLATNATARQQFRAIPLTASKFTISLLSDGSYNVWISASADPAQARPVSNVGYRPAGDATRVLLKLLR